MERVKGIEPSWSAWEADVLPLNYTRGAGPSNNYCKNGFSLRLKDYAPSANVRRLYESLLAMSNMLCGTINAINSYK